MVHSLRSTLEYACDALDAFKLLKTGLCDLDMVAIDGAAIKLTKIFGASHPFVKTVRRGKKVLKPLMIAKQQSDELRAKIPIEEVRTLLRQNGIDGSTIISLVVGSTLVLLLVLCFLFIGYSILSPEVNFVNGIIASIGVLGATGGANAAGSGKKGIGGGTIDTIRIFTDKLVEQWKQGRELDGQGAFTFSLDDGALETLQRARQFSLSKRQEQSKEIQTPQDLSP